MKGKCGERPSRSIAQVSVTSDGSSSISDNCEDGPAVLANAKHNSSLEASDCVRNDGLQAEMMG